MTRILRNFYIWKWNVRYQQWDLRCTRFGRSVATVWPNGEWHTWDNHGCGGWNSKCKYCDFIPFADRHFAAKREAWEACEKQGFL